MIDKLITQGVVRWRIISNVVCAGHGIDKTFVLVDHDHRFFKPNLIKRIKGKETWYEYADAIYHSTHTLYLAAMLGESKTINVTLKQLSE